MRAIKAEKRGHFSEYGLIIEMTLQYSTLFPSIVLFTQIVIQFLFQGKIQYPKERYKRHNIENTSTMSHLLQLQFDCHTNHMGEGRAEAYHCH